MKFLGIKWYWWAALLLPGGLIFWLYQQSKNQKAALADSTAAGTSTTRKVEEMATAARSAADALRAGTKDDPLAQQLLGIPQGLVGTSSPSKVVANQERADEIKQQIVNLQNDIAHVTERYGVDHYGGQSAEWFRSFLASRNAQISALSTELSGL